jgi:hypothetical protein
LVRKPACLVVSLLAIAAIGVFAPVAGAAQTSCDPGTLSQPFSHWLDYSQYGQVPGGTFENGLDGWKLSGGATTVSGNEPWQVSGPGSHALSLPAGASVVSPSFCGGLSYPTVRLFAKARGLVGALQVDVLYTGSDSLVKALPLGVVLAGSSWQPSLAMLTLSGLPLLTGTQLALRITAIGAVDIDDVYVDPFCRR